MIKFIFISIIFYSQYVFSQTGSIILHDHAEAQQLIEKHIYYNKEHNELPGWRIQIFASKSLIEAKNAKSTLLGMYDDLNAEIVFEAPNYKVRIGNYLSRFDANRYLQELIVSYPNAFICKDMIKINPD